MKFCPSQFQFLFYKYCYEKCPEYLVQNFQKKKCECPHLFYYDLDKNENICVDEHDEYKQLGYIYLDINLGEYKKYCREIKLFLITNVSKFVLIMPL